ncbi:MAG: tRNA 2-thiouridine(34) synthase MnmA [bacterium]|nr:tRNA 2-thiouridine(34) synthase MnmA [bacterium]
MKQETVAIGMSGGVDSSVGAYLLKEEGYNVIGITMKLINDEKTNLAIEDAKRVCQELGIKHHIIDVSKEFKEIVINNFISAYKSGKTPNPCVVCNKYFKFGLFIKKSEELGATKIATGHYAKIENNKLKMATTKEKDQSYFLYGINKDLLSKIIFPLSEYENKDKVREIAQKLNLSTKGKKDSQEICFIEDNNYINFLKENIKEPIKTGEICLNDDTVLATHNGIINYTVGQRKGLGISYKEPLYVTDINANTNKIIVGSNADLYKNTLIATDINLLTNNLPTEVYAKIRSRAMPSKATVTILNNKLIVTFQEAQRAITKGQSVVLYDKDDYVLGGGIIEEII